MVWNRPVGSTITSLGSKVTSVGSSQNMIDKAKEQFSDIKFRGDDAIALPFEKGQDIFLTSAEIKQKVNSGGNCGDTVY